MKKVCLCITNYNKEIYLERAIRSCLSQIQSEFIIEIILVNDGSKLFNKKKIKKEFPNIKIISYKKNKGVSYASNQALKKTNADYFMRVDADDFISIKTSMILVEFLNENSRFTFVYGDICKILINGNNRRLKRRYKKVLLQHGAGVMFRTKLLKKINGYNTKIKNCEDFDLIMRMILNFGEGYHLPIPYYRYYETKGIHLSKLSNRKKYISLLNKKYEKYL